MEKHIMKSKKVSNNPQDKNLEIHLVYLPTRNEYATYLYNEEFDSHYAGSYFETYIEALKDFEERN